MKTFLCFLVSLYGFNLTAQSRLLGGSAIFEIEGQRIHIQQTLDVQLPDSVQQLKLRLLDFNGTYPSNILAKSNGQIMIFEKEEIVGLTKINLLSIEPIKQIELSYWIEPKDSDFYIPLFFTDLPAANSDNGFFNVKIKLPKEQQYALHFPNVKIKEIVNKDLKNISFDVPALISVVRMEYFNNNKPSYGFASLMDGLVGLIFVLIGIVIWKNRKRLAYG